MATTVILRHKETGVIQTGSFGFRERCFSVLFRPFFAATT